MNVVGCLFQVPIKDHEKVLKKHQLRMLKQVDTVYHRVQLLKRSDGSTQPPFPSENSLHYFIRTKCKLTSHDVDFVFVDRFSKEVSDSICDLSFNHLD